MNSTDTIVTAAIIKKKNMILIAQRNMDSYLEANKWEFPGGKVKDDEEYTECLVREIREELGINITVESLFLKTHHIYEKEGKNVPILLYAYICVWKQGEICHIDCQDTRWVTASELDNFDFAAADIPIVKKLITEGF